MEVLLKRRNTYTIDAKHDLSEDPWLTEELSKDQDSFSIITTEHAVKKCLTENNTAISKYYVHEVFYLSNPLLMDSAPDIPFTYYYFSKKEPFNIYVGEYKNDLQGRKIDQLPAEYHEFLQNIVEPIRSADKKDYWWVSVIPGDAFDQQNPDLLFYSPEFNNMRGSSPHENVQTQNDELFDRIAEVVDPLLVTGIPLAIINTDRYSQKVLFSLNDIAAVIHPEVVDNNQSLVLDPENFTYPLNISSLEKKEVGTHTRLQRGDIVVTKENFDLYLVYTEPKEKIVAPASSFVIRPTEVLPEYLFLYLQSESFQEQLTTISANIDLMNLSERAICRLPIIVLEEADNMLYAAAFYAQFFSAKELDELLAQDRPYPAKPKKQGVDYNGRKVENQSDLDEFKFILILVKSYIDSF